MFSDSASAGLDFTPLTQAQSFIPGFQTARQCTNVQVLNDNILESDETFSVTLSSTDGSVNFANQSSVVTIIDNDGQSNFSVLCI